MRPISVGYTFVPANRCVKGSIKLDARWVGGFPILICHGAGFGVSGDDLIMQREREIRKETPS
jgi:hypothetical protein